MIPIFKLTVLSVALVALPAIPAQAMVNLTLGFTGTVSPGSSGYVQYEGYDGPPDGGTTFDRQPFTASLTLLGDPGSLYVSSFSVSWSDQAYSFPFITGWGGSGGPCDFCVDESEFVSTVSLSPDGGSISLGNTFLYEAYYNADFGLDLNFTFSQPRNPLSSFTDTGVSGGGSAAGYEEGYGAPRYDSGSNLTFTLSSMSQTGSVPEPAAWAMILLGFAGVGVAVRSRRPAVGA